MFNKRLEAIEENNLLLKSLLRIEANKIIIELKSINISEITSIDILKRYLANVEELLIVKESCHSCFNEDEKNWLMMYKSILESSLLLLKRNENNHIEM